jgi:hypothetical protein
MSLHYLFACEVDGAARSTVPWRTLSLTRCALDEQPLLIWDHVRHVLEVKHKVHGVGRNGGGARGYRVTGYLSAMHRDMFKMCGCKYDAAHRLRQCDQLRDGSVLIVFRKPAPAFLARYVPTRYAVKGSGVEESSSDDSGSSTAEDAGVEERKEACGDDEDARLQQIMAASVAATDDLLQRMQRPVKKQKLAASQVVHPDEYEYDKQRRPVPPPDYTCRGCGAAGEHFRQECPLEERNEDARANDMPRRKAVDKIFVPTGIPKTFLQHVTEDAVDKDTMVTRDGAFVKHMHPLHALRWQLASVSLEHGDAGDWRKTHWEEAEACGELFFEFEDYLANVVDVREAELVRKHAPARKIQFMCTHWLQGLCHKGVLCEYLHYYDVQFMPICKFFMEGKCTNGACTFRHDMPTSVKRVRACQEYVRGFCARGPSCPLQHTRRTAPCIADFEDKAVFHACVAAFERFMAEQHADVVRAKKRYQRAPAVTQKLYSLSKKMTVLK